MPELPEVEVVRTGLEAHLSGQTISAVTVLHPRPVRSHPSPEHFVSSVTGRDVTAIRRRGKYMWIVLDDVDALVVHLGMSGQFRVGHPGTEPHRHARVVFDLAAGARVSFLDQRMFGGLTLVPGEASLPVPHVARDPFDPEFDLTEVARRMRQRRQAVKRALLDQRLVSGIGNIYADEALWRARLHYGHPAASLSQRKATGLLGAATDVMREALAAGGTSFDALYVNVDGESGYFERGLHAYGREGLPCDRCGTPMRREQFTNRSSFRCPHCQRPPKVWSL